MNIQKQSNILIRKIVAFVFIIYTNIAFGHYNSGVENVAKIVTSTTPVYSIVSALVKDKVLVIAINDGSSGCPHHYQMKPSDKNKLAEADMAIYINDEFDVFMPKLLHDFSGDVVRISDMHSVNFNNPDGNNNWHFWMDLKNILALQNELSNILIQKWPKLKKYIVANKKESEEKIKNLMSLKSKISKGLPELVLISHSLEHFATDINSDVKITKIYKQQNESLRYIARLEEVLNSESRQCLLLDTEQDEKPFTKYGKKIIKVESENWSLFDQNHSHKHHDNHYKPNDEHNDHVDCESDHNKSYHNQIDPYEIFYYKYDKIINQLKKCHYTVSKKSSLSRHR